jgi:hypothetical protein
MIIKTIFDVGDQVFYLENNKIKNCIVGNIKIMVVPPLLYQPTILYYLGDNIDEFKMEHLLFASKELLKQSL